MVGPPSEADAERGDRLRDMAELVNLVSDQDVRDAGSLSSDALQFEEYRKLVRGHLGNLRALFTNLTGLETWVAWAPTWPEQWTAHDLPTRCRGCRGSRNRMKFGSGGKLQVAGCRLGGGAVGQLATCNLQPATSSQGASNLDHCGAAAPARCQSCAMKHLASTLKAGPRGHHFRCHQGLRNFWLPIVVRRRPVGIACVQALDGAGRRGDGEGEEGRRGEGRGEGRQVSRAEFGRAGKLLRLIVRHVQTSSLADLRMEELTRARQALLDFKTVQTRMRQELSRLSPVFRLTAVKPVTAGRSGQVLRRLLEYVHQNYGQPLTLRQLATVLRLNAAYLSALFSRRVGMPFKAYLTEARMERAKELLSDPTKNVSEAANAVGYASENRFRAAFKKATGLPPRLWRETLHLANAALVMWALEEGELVESLEMLF